MAGSVTAEVCQSAAVGILDGLNADGFRVVLTADGVLSIAPRSRLTPERMATVTPHKDDLRMLIRMRDQGVQDRRDAFTQQLANVPSGVLVPCFVFRVSPYIKGHCHACGETLERLRWGSCWRCSLARRLVCHAPVPSDLFMAYDEARICT
jgi:hypothetical protein